MQINQVRRQGNRSQLVDKCHDFVALVNQSFTIHNLELITNRELQIVNYELVM